MQKKQRTPFGIKLADYDKNSKFLKITFNIPWVGKGRKIQEIMPTVSYATFIDQNGKIYLFGNKNGLPIRLQEDINVSDSTLSVNLAPANWSENELPPINTNLNFVGLLVFPYLPPNFKENKFLRKEINSDNYIITQQYKEILFKGATRKYLYPVKEYDGLQVDAENPYFVPWVSNEKAWLRIQY